MSIDGDMFQIPHSRGVQCVYNVETALVHLAPTGRQVFRRGWGSQPLLRAGEPRPYDFASYFALFLHEPISLSPNGAAGVS